MKRVYDDNKDCCGCTACQHTCPAEAISMMPDAEGFLYPVIDRQRCLDCGKCREVCAFQNGWDPSANLETVHVYAARHRDDQVRLESTAGGLFTALSDAVLEAGGVVYGASLDEHMEVVHRAAFGHEDRNQLRGSKNVQSKLNSVFPDLKNLLEQGRMVLFTGTPCQSAGLKNYLKGCDQSNLLFCDFVCHGVGSPLIWREHLEFIQKITSQQVVGCRFRDKKYGWHGAGVTIYLKNGKAAKTSLAQTCTALYFGSYVSRECCHNCPYTHFTRPSDLTMGEFGNVGKSLPDFDDNKGVSLVLVNTAKGKALFDRVQEQLVCRESSIEDCRQPQLKHPPRPSPKRQQFWEDYASNGFEAVMKTYGGYNLQGRTVHTLKKAGRKALYRLGLSLAARKILG